MVTVVHDAGRSWLTMASLTPNPDQSRSSDEAREVCAATNSEEKVARGCIKCIQV